MTTTTTTITATSRHLDLVRQHVDYIVRYWKYFNTHRVDSSDANDAALTHFGPLFETIETLQQTPKIYVASNFRNVKSDEMYNYLMARTLFLNAHVSPRGSTMIESTNGRLIMGPLFWELSRLVEHGGSSRMLSNKSFLTDWLNFHRQIAKAFNICVCGRDAYQFLEKISFEKLEATDDPRINLRRGRMLAYTLHEYTKSDTIGGARNRQFGGTLKQIWPSSPLEDENFIYWTPLYKDDETTRILSIRQKKIGIYCEDAMKLVQSVAELDQYSLSAYEKVLYTLLPSRLISSISICDRGLEYEKYHLSEPIWLAFLVLCTLWLRDSWTRVQASAFVQLFKQIRNLCKLKEPEFRANFIIHAIDKYLARRDFDRDATPFNLQPLVNIIVFVGNDGRGTICDLINEINYGQNMA